MLPPHSTFVSAALSSLTLLVQICQCRNADPLDQLQLVQRKRSSVPTFSLQHTNHNQDIGKAAQTISVDDNWKHERYAQRQTNFSSRSLFKSSRKNTNKTSARKLFPHLKCKNLSQVS